MAGFTKSLLIITGTMGSGKTAVLAEASDILAQQGIVHAAVDLDALGLAHLPSARPNDAVMYANLRSVVGNYAALDIQRYLLARAIENDAQLNELREIVPAPHTVICRLFASIQTTQRRVALRESGILQSEYIARVAKLDAILDRARLEDCSVNNEGRPLTEVATEVLVRARWIPA
jgi:hypothetical protein